MITLVKIWNTEKDELINIVKENEHIHFNNRIINEDYNKGLKTNNFKYIHVIVSLISFELLDDFSKKIASNNNFILCEDNLFNGIKDIGFDNLFTTMKNITNLNEEYNLFFIRNIKFEYPDEKVINKINKINLIYMLSFYNLKILKKYTDNKYFKFFCQCSYSMVEFNFLFEYDENIDCFSDDIQNRLNLIEDAKRAIILSSINFATNSVFKINIINILEKYNINDIRNISFFIRETNQYFNLQYYDNYNIYKEISNIKENLQGRLKIFTNFTILFNNEYTFLFEEDKYKLLQFVNSLSDFKNAEEIYDIFKFLLSFTTINNDELFTRHLNFINNITKNNIENTLKYMKFLMPLDLEKRKLCEDQVKELTKFHFIGNLEPVLEQFKILFYDNRTDLSNIKNLNDGLILLIYLNKIPGSEKIPLNSNFNKIEFDPLQRIAKILLFCKHNKYNINNTLKFKLNLLYISSSTSYINFIKRLDIIEEPIITNNNIYDRGINVHNESRDDKTKTLILRFFELYSLTKDEEVKYFDEFWDYKRTLSPTKLEIFYRVCGYDENMNEIGRNTNDFGGFLTGDIVLGGVTYKAKNFIALFWKFASTFDDPNCINDEVRDEDCIERDRDNIKYGIINGLVDSLDVRDNHVVCNPGKIQRLAVSVLQGRIKDNGKLLYVDSGIEEVVVKDEYITNLNEIYNYLKPFYSFCTEHPTMEIERFFNEFFIFLNNLNVKVNYSYALYCIIMMSDSEDGLVINPELSLASNYDMFNINDYIEMYLTQEKIEFDLANPQIVAVRERRRIQNERNKIILRERNERIQMGNEDYF